MPDVFVAQKDHEHKKTTPGSVGKKAHPELTAKPVLPSILQGMHPRHMSSLSSYTEYPENIRFENQETNEVIYLFLRRHVVTNVPWVLLAIFFSILPFFFITFVLPALAVAGIAIPPNFLLVLLLFYYLIIFGYAFVSYVSWFFNISIVTNLRVFDIDVNDITSKSVASTEIEDALDVEYTQRGFLQNFFDYGHIHVQLAGMKPNFEFLSVPHPAKGADIISDVMREARHE